MPARHAWCPFERPGPQANVNCYSICRIFYFSNLPLAIAVPTFNASQSSVASDMRDFSIDDIQTVNWTEFQSKAEAAAFALGLGVAEAGRFGAAAARHLSADRPIKDLTALLAVPTEIMRYSRMLDDAIENSVLSSVEGSLIEAEASVLISFFEALPCAVEFKETREGLRVQIGLKEASKLSRSETLSIPTDLMNELKRIAEGGARPSTRGARLMEL